MNFIPRNNTPAGEHALARLLDQAARADAQAAPDLPTGPLGGSLEDRVFASTHRIVSAPTPVIARIGHQSRWGIGLRLAAAIALVGTIAIGYAVATRSNHTSRIAQSLTPAPAPTIDSGTELEFVLTAVSLLDEPLSNTFDDLAADAKRLHELVTTDRSFGAEQVDESSLRYGV